MRYRILLLFCTLTFGLFLPARLADSASSLVRRLTCEAWGCGNVGLLISKTSSREEAETTAILPYRAERWEISVKEFSHMFHREEKIFYGGTTTAEKANVERLVKQAEDWAS
ncbi:hypothetical protein LZ31DRAFT_579869 [Colletotrichum somersetense]|nr:hypothetical protein LZ31DRAFT_579869 [Colletotrichum somersetense]